MENQFSSNHLREYKCILTRSPTTTIKHPPRGVTPEHQPQTSTTLIPELQTDEKEREGQRMGWLVDQLEDLKISVSSLTQYCNQTEYLLIPQSIIDHSINYRLDTARVIDQTRCYFVGRPPVKPQQDAALYCSSSFKTFILIILYHHLCNVVGGLVGNCTINGHKVHIRKRINNRRRILLCTGNRSSSSSLSRTSSRRWCSAIMN